MSVFPVRCFSCNKVIGGMWYRYQELCEELSRGDALNALGCKRYCCRRMFLSHVDTADVRMQYELPPTRNKNGEDGEGSEVPVCLYQPYKASVSDSRVEMSRLESD